MLMALPTLGPVLLALICSFTYLTLPHALHNRVDTAEYDILIL